jgi:hypothetical protein
LKNLKEKQPQDSEDRHDEEDSDDEGTRRKILLAVMTKD